MDLNNFLQIAFDYPTRSGDSLEAVVVNDNFALLSSAAWLPSGSKISTWKRALALLLQTPLLA